MALTPDYLAHCTDDLLGLYDELDRAIIADIARRIVKTGSLTPTARHQVDMAQQSGMLLDEITKQVSQVTGLSEKEVSRLFQDAAVTGMKNDAKPLILNGQKVDLKLSNAMRDVLQAMIDKVNGDLRNLTLTTGATASGAYEQAINAASMQIQSGAFSYTQAIRQAIRQTARDGNYVTFRSGHRDLIDVAVRRSVLTGVNQTAGKLTEMYGQDLGCEYYETSAHAGARPSHAVWQGRVFKINGSDSDYPNFYESTGYGTGAGLCGWNCRHSFYPFFPGISKRAYSERTLAQYDAPRFKYNGTKLTEYEVSQLMRKEERGIRATKREISGYQAAADATNDEALKAELQNDYNQASVELKEQEAHYRDLCRQTNHQTDSTRTGVVVIKDSSGNIISWNKASAQKARRAADKAFKQEIAGTGADIGGPKNLAERLELRYSNKTESDLYDRYLRQVKNGTVSPLSTFDNYKKQYAAVNEKIVGVTTSEGTEIKEQSKHFIERIIGTMDDPEKHRPRSGVSVDDALNALKSPLQMKEAKNGKVGRSQRYVGEKGTVTINPDTGVLIQCNPTDSDIAERLKHKNAN